MPTAGDIFYFASKGGTTTKPPVVFIHDAGGNYQHFPHNLRRLPDYRIYALDLPGHGKSGGLGQQSVGAYAHEVIAWLQEIGLYQAVFVGHSMGGAIALTLALDHGEHVLGLGLLGTGARLRVLPDILDKLAVARTVDAGVDVIMARNFSPVTGAEIRTKVQAQIMATRPTVLHGDYMACDGFDVMARLKEIKVPVCVICGEDDALTPPKYSQYLAANVSQAKLSMIPNAGHFALLEQAEFVAAEVETFLKRVPY